MNVEEIREYCLLMKEVAESFPFDNETLVFKVNNKMFLLMSLDGPLRISLKCDPERAIELREQYAAVFPGYHMNKRLWNTVQIDGSIDDELIKEWISDSYRVVVASMPKKERTRIMKN
jgi:predicted DNA-binding protein (MmcQ/YjbR family)